MPEARPELAPISDAVTHNVKVEVLSQYSKENSRPLHGEWVLTIELGTKRNAVQLGFVP